MTCEQVKQLLPEWLDGEVDAMRAKKIEGHIATCPSCAHEAAFWQEVRAALQEEQNVTAPAGFAAGVIEALPEKSRRPWQELVSRWKRGIAAAAAFLLVAAGSAGAYFNWGLNTASHVAENGSKTPGFASGPEDPETVNPGTGETLSPETGDNINSNAGKTPPENGKTPGSGGDNEENKGRDVENNESTSGNMKEDTGSEQYVFCSADLDADKERAARHTLLKVKVYDIQAARALAVKHINQAGGSYEALGADPAGGESLKITVNENRSGILLANLKNLGRVVTENTQVDNINERYREKVEMYRTLAGQVQAAGDPQEQAQLETKLKAIEAQLLAWEKEAQRDTIILWLEE